MALTKLDTLTGLDPIRICVGYRKGRKTLTDFPSDLSVVERARPVYEDLPGWKENIQDARSLSDLPRNTVRYIRRLEKLLGVPFYFVSVGPQRQQSIVLENPLRD
jgi:adenylosuccinate synthase